MCLLVYDCVKLYIDKTYIVCVWDCVIWKWDYDNWIADQCGIPRVEEWRVQMYVATSKNRVLRPESYRDEWDDDDLVLQAQRDFANYSDVVTNPKLC